MGIRAAYTVRSRGTAKAAIDIRNRYAFGKVKNECTLPNWVSCSKDSKIISAVFNKRTAVNRDHERGGVWKNFNVHVNVNLHVQWNAFAKSSKIRSCGFECQGKSDDGYIVQLSLFKSLNHKRYSHSICSDLWNSFSSIPSDSASESRHFRRTWLLTLKSDRELSWDRAFTNSNIKTWLTARLMLELV